MKLSRLLISALALTSLISPFAGSVSASAPPGGSIVRTIGLKGTSTLTGIARPDGPDVIFRNAEIAVGRAGPDAAVATKATVSGKVFGGVNRSFSERNGARAAKGGPADKTGIANTNPELSLSFQGLFHRNQRLANGGNQFSIEPPDQGLCVGNGFVLETVNTVMRLFDLNGNPVTGPIDLNS